MKTMMSVLSAMILAFALASSAGAATQSPYACGVESPAYPDYTNARAVPCDQGQDQAAPSRTPDPMSTPGF